MTRSLLHLVDLLQEHIYFGSRTFSSILQEHDINHAVGLYIAKYFLVKNGYTFHRAVGNSELIDVSTCLDIPENMVCKSPMSRAWAVFGVTSASEMVDDPESHMFRLLESIASAGAKGRTSVELAKDCAAKNFHTVLDRLYISGAVVKRSVFPSQSKQCRVRSFCSLFHLKKYAAHYDPQADGLNILPDDQVKFVFFQHIADILRSNGLTYISTSDLSSYLGLSKRQMQYIRNLVVAQQKSGGCAIHAVQRRCMPLSARGKPGCPRIGWCLTLTDNELDATKTITTDFCTRLRNQSVWEQIDLYIRRRGEFTTTDMRRYVSIGRKKTQKFAAELLSTFKYPSVKTQDGRVFQIKVLPKPGTAFDPLPFIEDDNAWSTATSSAVVVKTPSKRAREDDDEANVSTDVNPESDTLVDSVIDLGFSLPQSIRNRFSVEREERLAYIYNYLKNQAHGVGSLLEVSQLLRRSHREKSSMNLDKKTIVRMIQMLVDHDIIEERQVELDEGQTENFGGGVRSAVVLILKDFPDSSLDVESRVEDYLNSYVHIKTVYKRKDVATDDMNQASTTDADETDAKPEISAVQPLDLDRLLSLDGDQTLDATQKTRRKRSRIMSSTTEMDDSCEKISKQHHRKPPLVRFSDLLMDDIAQCVQLDDKGSALTDIEDDEQIAEHGDFVIDSNTQKIEKSDRAAAATPKEKAHRREKWTDQEDIQLLLNFFNNYFILRSRVGLPDCIKPQKLRRHSGPKLHFVISPWKSFNHFSSLNVDFVTIRSRGFGKIHSHSLISCGKRLRGILQNFGSMTKALATVLWESRGCLDESTHQLFRYVLGSANKISAEDAITQTTILASVYKHIGTERSLFRHVDLFTEDKHYNACVMRTLRELFFSGMIKSVLDGNSQMVLGFRSATLNSAIDRPLGGFITQFVQGDYCEDSSLSGLQANLLLPLAITTLEKYSVGGQSQQDTIHVTIDVSAEVGEDQKSPQIVFGPSNLENVLQVSTGDGSLRNALSKRRTDLIDADICVPTVFSDDFQEKLASVPAVSLDSAAAQMPWFNSDGAVNLKALRVFTTEILTLCTDRPQCTAEEMYRSLPYFPATMVDQLLNTLTDCGILKSTVALVSVKNSAALNPFALKNALFCRALKSPTDPVKYYSINL